jgi:hypothetical protein
VGNSACGARGSKDVPLGSARHCSEVRLERFRVLVDRLLKCCHSATAVALLGFRAQRFKGRGYSIMVDRNGFDQARRAAHG